MLVLADEAIDGFLGDGLENGAVSLELVGNWKGLARRWYRDWRGLGGFGA